jgi:hypothetical protein
LLIHLNGDGCAFYFQEVSVQFISGNQFWKLWTLAQADGRFLMDESEKERIISDLREFSNLWQTITQLDLSFESQDIELLQVKKKIKHCSAILAYPSVELPTSVKLLCCRVDLGCF